MKSIKTMIMLGAFALMSAAPLLAVQAQQGVRCNDERQVCADKNGPNVELTRQKYGDQAAQRLQRYLSKGEGGGQQPQRPQQPQPQQPQQPQRPQQPQQRPQQPQQQSGDVFSPTTDVRCVRSEQVCYHYNQPSSIFTQKYFGGAAAARLNSR